MKRFNPDKELRKIQHGNRNKILYGIIALLLIISIGSTYALYQVRYSKRIIYTKVAPFSNKDIQLAVYLDGSPSTSDFPEKNSGYRYDKIVCDNGSTATFDNLNWELNLKAKNKDKCNVYFVKTYKDASGANVPELYQGLIPVTYDSSGNIKIANVDTEWYDYGAHNWANAVLVSSSNYDKYVENGKYKSATIPMSEILQMYVWIPRYKYQLFNVNNVGVEEQEIKIQFESGTSNTGDIECRYTNNNNGTITEKCTKKGTETNAQNGDWYTHPAFTFKGTFDESGTELTGIWVGKFESSGNDSSLIIKPNISSWRNLKLKTMFDASRNIDLIYFTNFNLDTSQIDTHMMKNMEWGAMAYLTQSKYGRCDGQGNCTEIAQNTQSDYKTGYNGTEYTWETEEGQKASTTGNMYGIYDTNGGTVDYVMGNMVNTNGTFYSSNADFSVTPNSKYYDVYGYDSNSYTTHQRGHLGDATRETLKILDSTTGGWYGDNSSSLQGYRSWFVRGGRNLSGDDTGIFCYSAFSGIGDEYSSFRVVLTAQDGNE